MVHTLHSRFTERLQVLTGHWSVLLCGVYLLFFLIHLYFGSDINNPFIHVDEAGYIANARHVFHQSHLKTSYYPGYSLLISPAFFFSNNLDTAYKIIQVINALLTSFVPVLGYWLLRMAFGNRLLRRDSLLIAVLVSLFPAFLLYPSLAISEVSYVPIYLLLITLLFGYRTTVGRWQIAYLFGTALSFAMLWLTHPRALALFPALLAFFGWELLRRRDWRIWRDTGLLLVAVVVLKYALFDVYFSAMRGDSGYVDTGSTIFRVIKVNFFQGSGATLHMVTNLFGQSLYLVLSSLGIAAITVYEYARYFRRRWSERFTDPLFAVMGFIFLGFLGTLFLSAMYMNKENIGLAHFRADHIIYARYNEGVIAPFYLIGLGLFLLGRFVRRKLLISFVLLTPLVALFFWRESQSFHVLPFNIYNALGFYYFRLFGDGFGFATVFWPFLVAATVFWTLTLYSRSVGLVLGMVLFVSLAVYTNHAYLIKGAVGREDERVLTQPLTMYQEISDNRSLLYDRATRNYWHEVNYQIYLPDLQFIRFDSREAAYPQDTDLILSGRWDLAETYAGARLIGLENHYAQGLWLLPGVAQDVFVERGEVLPKDFPTKLPVGAMRSELSLVDYVVNNTDAGASVRLEITHSGGEAFWPNLYGVRRPEYSVRVGTQVYSANSPETLRCSRRAELPQSLYPGMTVRVDVPLDCEDMSWDGRYLTKIGLIQEAVTWFVTTGDQRELVIWEKTGGTIQVLQNDKLRE